LEFALLLPQFGNVAMAVLAFVVALSVIVAVHEYGHYIVGRWCGIKAEVFSLGFGPILFSRLDKHGTRWQVAALPLGGYVKFKGDADAASATESDVVAEMSPEERRQTMAGAPLWARSATVAAGPMFNFILSIAVFGAVIMTQGKVAEPLTVGEIHPLPQSEFGLQAGDELLGIAGQEIPVYAEEGAFGTFVDSLPKQEMLEYRVRRDGREITVGGPYPQPTRVMRLAPQSAAYETGLKPGDVIVGVEGRDIIAFDQLKEVVESSNGRPLALDVWRDGDIREFVLTPRRVDEPQPEGGFRTQWRIGIAGGMAFDFATESMGPAEALLGGVEQTWDVMASSVSGLYHMIIGSISACNMSGPIGIAEVSGAMASQGADSFIWFIAVLSAAIGFLNLFPIPVLDGGHLVFYAFEAVTGKPPSDGVLRILMAIGLSLVLALMSLALITDILC
jgi:regulator of sigma E protease